MIILKWFSFALIFLDVIGYIIEKAREVDNAAKLFGLITGILCRAFVLYGTVTCWLLG